MENMHIDFRVYRVKIVSGFKAITIKIYTRFQASTVQKTSYSKSILYNKSPQFQLSRFVNI